MDQMIIRIDRETKQKLARLAKMGGKSSSEVVRELVERYIRERDMSGYLY